MIGIILAGGNGTRLYPITKVISKQSKNIKPISPNPNQPVVLSIVNILFAPSNFTRVTRTQYTKLEY